MGENTVKEARERVKNEIGGCPVAAHNVLAKINGDPLEPCESCERALDRLEKAVRDDISRR